jgi:hypothetical protein
VANPAGLGENLPAQFLRGGQVLVGGGLLRRRTPRRQHAQEDGRTNGQESGRANRGAALHLNPPDIRFFCKVTPARRQAEGLDPEQGGLTGMRSREGSYLRMRTNNGPFDISACAITRSRRPDRNLVGMTKE